MCPIRHEPLDRSDVAYEAQHHFRFRASRDDVRLCSARDGTDVDRRRTEHRVGRKIDIVNRRKQPKEWLDRRGAKLRVRRVRLAPVCTYDETQGALAAACEAALGGLTIYEIATGGVEIVRGTRAIRALLFTDDEKQIYAILAVSGKLLRRRHHRGGYSLGIAGAASVQPVAAEPWRVKWRDGVEMRG